MITDIFGPMHKFGKKWVGIFSNQRPEECGFCFCVWEIGITT